VVIWAVAPLTNAARAIESQPEVVDSIEWIVIMGGAADIAGNTFSGGAEWNFAIDPEAPETVVSSGIP
jgi:purine nucleosidase